MISSSSSLLPFNADGFGQLLVEKFEAIEAEENVAIQQNDNIGNPASVQRYSMENLKNPINSGLHPLHLQASLVMERRLILVESILPDAQSSSTVDQMYKL